MLHYSKLASEDESEWNQQKTVWIKTTQEMDQPKDDSRPQNITENKELELVNRLDRLMNIQHQDSPEQETYKDLQANSEIPAKVLKKEKGTLPVADGRDETTKPVAQAAADEDGHQDLVDIDRDHTQKLNGVSHAREIQKNKTRPTDATDDDQDSDGIVTDSVFGQEADRDPMEELHPKKRLERLSRIYSVPETTSDTLDGSIREENLVKRMLSIGDDRPTGIFRKHGQKVTYMYYTKISDDPVVCLIYIVSCVDDLMIYTLKIYSVYKEIRQKWTACINELYSR